MGHLRYSIQRYLIRNISAPLQRSMVASAGVVEGEAYPRRWARLATIEQSVVAKFRDAERKYPLAKLGRYFDF